MNYKIKRNIKAITQKSRRSRNVFVKLNHSHTCRDRIKMIRKRAQLFQKLQLALTNYLKIHLEKKEKVTIKWSSKSFYDEQLLCRALHQKRFYNIIKEGDHKFLDVMYAILANKNLPNTIIEIVKVSIQTIHDRQIYNRIKSVNVT